MRFVPLALFAASIGAFACVSTTDAGALSGSQYSLTLDSTFTDSARVPVGSVLPIHVRLTLNGTPLAGAAVGWVVDSGGGRVANASLVTDSLGVASALWVIGDTARFNMLTVGSAGDSVVLRARGIPGAPSGILRVTRDSSGAAAGSPVTIDARVVDAFGNAISGAIVNWTATNGSLSAASSTTNATGDATTVLTTAGAPDSYLVTASVPGQASVTFLVVTF